MGLNVQIFFTITISPLNKGEDLFIRIDTGDELLMHHYCTLKLKLDSIQWKHSSSPTAAKFKVILSSTGKVVYTMFWDSQEVLLIYLQRLSENVKSC